MAVHAGKFTYMSTYETAHRPVPCLGPIPMCAHRFIFAHTRRVRQDDRVRLFIVARFRSLVKEDDRLGQVHVRQLRARRAEEHITPGGWVYAGEGRTTSGTQPTKTKHIISVDQNRNRGSDLARRRRRQKERSRLRTCAAFLRWRSSRPSTCSGRGSARRVAPFLLSVCLSVCLSRELQASVATHMRI